MPTQSHTNSPREARAARILIVDDDHEIRRLLLRFLERESDFQLYEAKDAVDLNAEVMGNQIDLVVLDVFLPQVNGYDALRSLREISTAPVIMLTAAGEIEDRLHGLELGADDYVIKPFDPRELLARIHNVLARSHPQDLSTMRPLGPVHSWLLNGFEIDLRMRKLRRLDGQYETLSEREARLLQTLLQNPMKTLSREFLLTEVFGSEDAVITRAIDVLISRVRKRFGDEGQDLINSVRGSGYVLQGRPVIPPPPNIRISTE